MYVVDVQARGGNELAVVKSNDLGRALRTLADEVQALPKNYFVAMTLDKDRIYIHGSLGNTMLSEIRFFWEEETSPIGRTVKNGPEIQNIPRTLTEAEMIGRTRKPLDYLCVTCGHPQGEHLDNPGPAKSLCSIPYCQCPKFQI